MRNEESKLQQSCITWLRLQYPRLAEVAGNKYVVCRSLEEFVMEVRYLDKTR